MNTKYYAVIMAGGIGSRFWPVSTAQNPKQFHDMLGTGETLLQRTFKRLSSFIPGRNILILTNVRYNDLVLEQLPSVRPEQLVLEPAMRNTAPCILYAAMKIHKRDPEARILVAPSDHWIEDEEAFARDVMQCFRLSEKEEVLCTLGIKPTFPNTGYGYIECESSGDGAFKKVFKFHEKPGYEQAKSYLEKGNYLWNAGIFVWRAQTILKAFKSYQPELFGLFEAGIPAYNTSKEKSYIDAHYAEAENISIDYAILEKSEAIYVLPAGFDWNDLGTWGSLYEKLEKDPEDNAMVNGRLLSRDTHGNMFRTGKGKLLVVEGLSDYIVVDREDVLLIIPRAREQDIKLILARVKETYGDQFE